MPATKSAITTAGGTEYAFIALRGAVPQSGEQIEEKTRPGFPGVAFRLMGARAVPFALTGVVDVADAAAAKTLLGALAGLQGSLVTLLDDGGNSYASVCVRVVTPQEVRKITSAVGGVSAGAKGFLVTVRIEMQISV